MSSEEDEPDVFAQYVGSDEEPLDDDGSSTGGDSSGDSDPPSEQDAQEAQLQKSALAYLSALCAVRGANSVICSRSGRATFWDHTESAQATGKSQSRGIKERREDRFSSRGSVGICGAIE